MMLPTARATSNVHCFKNASNFIVQKSNIQKNIIQKYFYFAKLIKNRGFSITFSTFAFN